MQWSPCGLLSCTADEIAFDLVIDYAEDNDGWYESDDWFKTFRE